MHRVRLSPAERVARRFQALELLGGRSRGLESSPRLDPKSRKGHAVPRALEMGVKAEVRPGADLTELHEA